MIRNYLWLSPHDAWCVILTRYRYTVVQSSSVRTGGSRHPRTHQGEPLPTDGGKIYQSNDRDVQYPASTCDARRRYSSRGIWSHHGLSPEWPWHAAAELWVSQNNVDEFNSVATLWPYTWPCDLTRDLSFHSWLDEVMARKIARHYVYFHVPFYFCFSFTQVKASWHAGENQSTGERPKQSVKFHNTWRHARTFQTEELCIQKVRSTGFLLHQEKTILICSVVYVFCQCLFP